LFLLTSCVDVEKKYADYKINNEVQHFGAKRVELKEDVYVYEYDGVKSYSDFGLKGQYENEEELTFLAWVCPYSMQYTSLIDNYSISIWLKNRGIVTCNIKYKLDEKSKLELNAVNSKTKYEINEWLFITMIYKKNTYLKLFINGTLENIIEPINSYGLNYTFSNYYVGKSNYSVGNTLFKGKIDTDEIKIYNTELSDNDLKNYYSQTKKRYAK